jgi:hypothetical protein
MQKDYTKYNAKEFSTDFYFLQWRIGADEPATRFWLDFIEKNPDKKPEINAAIRIIDSIRINDYHFSEEELDAALKQINSRKTVRFARKKSILWVSFAIASCVALLFVLRFVPDVAAPFHQGKISTLTVADVNRDIRLVLGENGSMSFDQNTKIMYDNTGNVTISDLNKNKILLQGKLSKSMQLNKLIVPKGKRSSLVLPDGSKVWVNSGSNLRFPGSFAKNIREIWVDGEIYIEVVKDPSRPFIVKTSRFDVEVLGTKFNVAAYNEDAKNEVALAEGSVKVVDHRGHEAKIVPNELLTISENGLHKETVDIYNYTSWVDGIFKFTNEPLKNILIKISRYYNLSLDCSDDISDVNISGKLVLFDDPETALNNISIIVPIQYKVKDYKFIIGKK